MNTRFFAHKVEDGARPEGGFTLLEMVIAVILLVLITGAITAALTSSLTATSATKTRVDETNDAQLIQGFFIRDAQAAGGTNPATGYADPTLGVTVPANNGCSAPAGTSIIGFTWIDLSTGTTYESNYSYVASASGGYKPQQFLRTVCSTAAQTGTQILANNVVTTAAPPLQPPSSSCNPNACTSIASFPKTVSMTISDYQNSASNLTTSNTFTLTASLRPQSGAPDTSGTSGAQTAPLLLLSPDPDSGCTGTGTAGITGTGTPGLFVYGIGVVDTCPTAALSGAATAQASGGVLAYAPPWASTTAYAVGDIVSYNGTVYQATRASTNQVPPNATYWSDTDPCRQVTGTCSVTTTPYSDPFAAEIAAGKLSPPSISGCSGGSNPGLGGDGKYQPGTYPMTLNANKDFDPGVYVFCAGVSFSGTVRGTGVLFYVSGGTLSVGNNASVTLSPIATGPYAATGLAVWQAAGDANALTSGNSNNILVDINGTVYAPSARVSFKNGQVHLEGVIALGVDLPGGGGGVNIGPVTPIVVTTATPPNGTQNQAYPGATMTASGGAIGGGYRWTQTGLPAGMSVNPSTGVIGGTPTVNTGGGTVTVTITATDVFNNRGQAHFELKILSSPTVTAANPNTMNRGATNQTVTLTGTNFVTGATASFNDPNIAVTNPSVTNSSTMTIKVTIAASASPGQHAITVTNGDGEVTTGNNLFTVTNPSVVSLVSSNANGSPGQGDVITITFSAALDANTICSTWTAGAQSASSTSTRVTLTKNASGNDTLSVFDPCTLHVFASGSMNIGATGYVATPGAAPQTTVFGNASKCNEKGHCSAVSINAAHTVLTITLGDLLAGTAGTVNTNPGITYTPDPGITAGGVQIAGTATDNTKFF